MVDVQLKKRKVSIPDPKDINKDLLAYIRNKGDDGVEDILGANIELAGSDNMFSDFSKMLDLLTDDKNVFKLSIIPKRPVLNNRFLYNDAIGKALSDCDRTTKAKEFYMLFSFHYHINLASLEGSRADQFRSIAEAFISFKSMLEYRGAVKDDQETSLFDR